jgi:aquaporin Z
MASAIPAQDWNALWVYFMAPLFGMLLASEVYVRWKGQQAVRCAKLHHQNDKRCIFRCGYPADIENGQRLLSDSLPSS